MLDDATVARFRASGFVVLPAAFDPHPLSDEMDRAFLDGHRSPASGITFAEVEVSYLVMMCERTPASLALLDALAAPAAELLGRAVLPMRAKGIRYFGDTAWHKDSELDVPSIGFAAYLESLDAGNGALRVRPGSHLDTSTAPNPPAEEIATKPGDIIAFDEHLAHGSAGGGIRRQWRVDFIADPADDREEALVRSYFARILEVGWDGGYDVDRYPNYDPTWQARDRPWTERLRALGVYDLADAHEDAVRACHLGG